MQIVRFASDFKLEADDINEFSVYSFKDDDYELFHSNEQLELEVFDNKENEPSKNVKPVPPIPYLIASDYTFWEKMVSELL